MKILAFDSTAKVASVAVCEDGELLALYNIDNGLTQSELLLPMAESILKALKLSFSDVDALACAIGPGSFTGVRIGAALVKGLAFGKNIPCIEVSTLEELAMNLHPSDSIIISCMDARRSQVYTATFRSGENGLERLTEDRAISIEQLANEIKEANYKEFYITGDGYKTVTEYLLKAGIRPRQTPPLLISENAYSCAKVAYEKYKAGDFKSDSEIFPTYLRMPQAERERLEKLEQNKEN